MWLQERLAEKWSRHLDKGGSCSASLTTVIIAFDCIAHDFLIAKLQGHAFTYEALNVMKTTFQIEHIEQN